MEDGSLLSQPVTAGYPVAFSISRGQTTHPSENVSEVSLIKRADSPSNTTIFGWDRRPTDVAPGRRGHGRG